MRAPRFIADAMLGRLARWLRLLGYDTAYHPAHTKGEGSLGTGHNRPVRQADLTDSKLVERSRRERRVILTRDRGVLRHRAIQAVFVSEDGLWDQLRQVMAVLGLRFDPARVHSRCPLCNAPLKAVDREDVRSRVPAQVLEEQSRFFQCPRCRKVYWQGSHPKRLREAFARVRLSDPPSYLG